MRQRRWLVSTGGCITLKHFHIYIWRVYSFIFLLSKYKVGLLSLAPTVSAALQRPPAVQLLVQLSQLLQEARVWRDVPVGAHCLDGVGQGHALMDHQVGQDQGGGAAQPHGTVDQHSTCGSAQHKNSLRGSSSSSATKRAAMRRPD